MKSTVEIVHRHRKTRHGKLADDEWVLLAEAIGERKGSKNPAQYLLYQNRETQELRGLMISRKHTTTFYLGHPLDVSGMVMAVQISIAKQPSSTPFARRHIQQNTTRRVRPEYLKFIMEYLKHTGVVTELKEREISSGAILYKHGKKLDGSSPEFGETSAGAITR
jgi:hypothetical protein